MNITIDLTSPIFCFVLCIGCGISWLLWKRYNWKVKYWIIPIFIFYALVLIKLTIFPIYIFDDETLDKIREGAGKYFVFYQMIPFASIKNYFHTGAFIQLIGNIVLLSPFVAFVEIFLRQRSKPWKVALTVSSISFLIEIVQLSINLITEYPGRVADVDDLFLNISGVVFTIILTRYIGKRQNMRSRLQKFFYRGYVQ